MSSVYIYSGLSVAPRIKSERPPISIKGTGAEISASLLEQEITVYSRNGMAKNEKLQTLERKVKVEQSLQNGSMRFSLVVEIFDPRYRLLFLSPARMVRYSYLVYGSLESTEG